MAFRAAPSEFLSSLLDHYGDYHNHKEHLVYLAATLYLVGAGWLIGSEPFWKCHSKWEFWSFAGVVAFAAAMGLGFVLWQLARRREANDICMAIQNIAAQWLEREPAAEELRSENTETFRVISGVEVRWPRALSRELKLVRDREDVSLFRMELLTVVLLGMFGAATLTRIIHAWLTVTPCS